MKFSDLANSFKPNIFDPAPRLLQYVLTHKKRGDEFNLGLDQTYCRVGADQKGSAAPQYVHFITSAHLFGLALAPTC